MSVVPGTRDAHSIGYLLFREFGSYLSSFVLSGFVHALRMLPLFVLELIVFHLSQSHDRGWAMLVGVDSISVEAITNNI